MNRILLFVVCVSVTLTSYLSGQVRVVAIETVAHVRGTYPSWSPDGLSLAYERDGDLFLSALDGSTEVQLTRHPSLDETPVWAPDGQSIVFASERTGELDIFTIAIDGSTIRRLTTHPADDDHPRYNAIGTHLVFNSKRHDGETYQVWRMDADGASPERLTRHDEWDTYPSLSSDGRRLLWRRVLLEDGQRNSEIFVMDLGSRRPQNLSRHPSFDGYPVWSPDETYIAFASDRDSPGEDQLFVMRFDGSDVTLLNPLTPGVQYARPSWSPRGGRLVATREAGSVTELVIITIEGLTAR